MVQDSHAALDLQPDYTLELNKALSIRGLLIGELRELLGLWCGGEQAYHYHGGDGDKQRGKNGVALGQDWREPCFYAGHIPQKRDHRACADGGDRAPGSDSLRVEGGQYDRRERC